MKYKIKQGQLQEWTEHSHTAQIFENLKPVEMIKKSFQKLYKFSKLGGCGSNIMPVTPI